MLIKNDIEYRNLEEQVAYNTALLNLFPEGLGAEKFRGVYITAENLKPGEYCLVGEGIPYTLWYRTPEGTSERLVNLGEFPRLGPQGPTGLRGPEGPKGKDGTNWELSVEDLPAGPAGELWLKLDTGEIFQSTGNSWVLQGTIRGPKGAQGERGLRGIQGPAGPQGPAGADGLPGGSYKIEGIVDTVNMLPPDPPRDLAYLVKVSSDPENPEYFLYIYLMTMGEWVNVGRFTPQTVGIVQTTGVLTDAVMSQKATTETINKARREASAMGVGKPNFVGDLRKFAYMKEYNKVWKEEFGRVYLADAEGDQADYYTAYAVYFGENYNPDWSYIFTDDPYPYYIRFAGSDTFDKVDPADIGDTGALNWKLAYGDNLAEVRFSLSDDGWFSTLPLEGFQDFATYVNVQPLMSYNHNGITDSGDTCNFGNIEELNYNNVDYNMSFRNLDDVELEYAGFTVFDSNDDVLLSARFDIENDDITVSYMTDPTSRILIERSSGSAFPVRGSAANIKVHWNGETAQMVFQSGGATTTFNIDHSLPNFYDLKYIVLEAPTGTPVQLRVHEHPTDNWYLEMRGDGIGERLNDNNIRVVNLLALGDDITPKDTITNQFNTCYRMISSAIHRPKNVIIYLDSLNYEEIPKWVYDNFVHIMHSLGIEITIGVASNVYNDNPDFPDSFNQGLTVESIQADTPAMIAYQLEQLAK